MAEKIISPGVFTNEIDQSFLPAAIGEIGAVVIGPTVKGPALVPTVVSSYGEFQEKFGSTFKSGSSTYNYLTSTTAQNYLKNSGRLTVVRTLAGNFSDSSASISASVGSVAEKSFKIHTLTHGSASNNLVDKGLLPTTNNIIPSGTKDQIRYEISNVNNSKGTFTLLVRSGNDTIKRKQVLETWSNLSLDPNQKNYISKVIGDVDQQFKSDDGYYIKNVGDYPNKSKYIRVSAVKDTIDYLDENGQIRVSSASGSLPAVGSGSQHGSFGGGSDGDVSAFGIGDGLYDKITTAANVQGLNLTVGQTGHQAYLNALNLMSNQDEYDINMILIPGVIQGITGPSAIVDKAIQVCEDRGDAFTVVDPVAYGSTISQATTEAEAYDSNFAAMYWPWVQVPENELGRNIWVPPSVVIPGIYAFNDKVAHPWFAPAGLNRGGIDVAVQAERKLTQGNRDTLYDANVNPIATFPGQGVCVWGQKTLQKKSSALDRVNVRRLMIAVKKFIASTSRFLVFEQNSPATRKKFLNVVNPYLEQVQSNSGLSAFKVVMDDTNNTPDVVDRNILYGQLFLQPTRTAEFVVLDFTVQPTGATFPE
tara:strand:+ start:1438 stop:3207 length:1770 start_codon:yes stop_codon:yes gene_type:complete